MSDLLGVIKVTSVNEDDENYYAGHRVTLERQDGKTFTVNIPDNAWGDGSVYGLNLVYGEGCHYT